jgi:hypothetical protein
MKIKFYLIELISIAYFTTIFVSVGIILTELNDTYIINQIILDDQKPITIKNKSLIRHVIETIIIFITLTIIVHYTKLVLMKMPCPFDGIDGFNHNNQQTITAATVLGLSVFLFSTGLKEKIRIINERLHNS